MTFRKTNQMAAGAVGVIMNGPVSLGAAAAVIGFSAGFPAAVGMFTGMVGILSVAALLNVVLALAIYKAVGSRIGELG